MLSPAGVPGTIPGYELRVPTEADARAALHRVFGAAKGDRHWEEACGAASLEPGRVSPGAELERAAEALGRQGGAAAMVARSIEIRMRTYARLVKNVRAAASPGEGR
jgi:hypothetical protein